MSKLVAKIISKIAPASLGRASPLRIANTTAVGAGWCRSFSGEADETGGDRIATSPLAGEHQSPLTAMLWQQRLEEMKNEGVYQQGGNTFAVDEITGKLVKTPADTRTVLYYNFSSDEKLHDAYRNPWNYIRHGMVLEDLDALAGNVAARHCADGNPDTPNPKLVTASVDKILLKNRLRVDHDLKLTGQVRWVGRSALLVGMEIADETDDGKILVDAGFVFVARDRETNKADVVNRLRPETEVEKALFQEAEERDAAEKAMRKNVQQQAQAHEENEQAVVELLKNSQKSLVMPSLVTEDVVLMAQTRVENSMITQPQHRNLSDQIFGGFLMRRAFELAFTCCYLHGGSRPHFVELEEVQFKRPVEIGDMLRIEALVTYATMSPSPVVHVEVTTSVVRPEERVAQISNIFNFTFALNLHLEPEGNQTMKEVVPSNEHEARKYLRGKHFVSDNF